MGRCVLACVRNRCGGALVSKSVRLKDYLAAELEEIAKRENRSLANLVNKLLEQAIEMDNRPMTREHVVETGSGKIVAQSTTTPAIERNRVDADAQARDAERRQVQVAPVEDHFRPDPKQGKKK